MKVCVIGNSHVGALRPAWDRLRTTLQNMELTFFAQRGTKITELVAAESRLVPSSKEQQTQLEFTSGGAGSVDPGAYDLFLVYGLYYHAPLTEDGSRYSQAVREAAVLDRAASRAYKMVQLLRSVTRKPVYVGLSPLPANLIGNPLPPPILPYDEVISLLDREFFRPLDARLIPQPGETIADGRATAIRYSKGSRRLDVGVGTPSHPDADAIHMNDDYGRIWLTSFQQRLAK